MKQNKVVKNLTNTYGANYVSAFQNNNVDVIKQKLVDVYSGMGFLLPDGSKFWKINGLGKDEGLYGLQVGSFIHSCHVDSTDLIVLLIINGCNSYVDDVSDFWLSNCIKI